MWKKIEKELIKLLFRKMFSFNFTCVLVNIDFQNSYILFATKLLKGLLLRHNAILEII
jgi:hypothetical protein